MKLLAARSIVYSVILHLLAFGLLLVSLDISPPVMQPAGSTMEIIDAVAIDSSQVEQELNRVREVEQQRVDAQARQQRELENKLNELEKKTQQAEQQRKQEELRLADLKKKQQAEEVRRKEEEQKLAEARKKQEELAKTEAEKKRLAEEQRKKEELAKAEAEKKRLEEEAQKKKLAEEARQKQEAEARAAAAAAAASAEQDRQDQGIIGQFVGRIQGAITREFNTAGLPTGLSCILQIRMIPGGEVVEARIVKSSGNAVFDSRAELAVKRASPLPVPEDQRVFNKMREIRLTFAPN
jgi:colicin import membrane protein